MIVLPVLDLLNGVVVRGVAGERDQYRPLVSPLAESADPLTLARAFRTQFGLESLYIADLDAILAEAPNLKVYEALAAEGFRLYVDAGLRNLSVARQVHAAGAHILIAGLESIPGPEFLGELCSEFSPERVVFSLDLKNGEPLTGPSAAWPERSPEAIAAEAVARGVSQFILLDLASVGVSRGVPTLELASRIKARHPAVRIITGGGVRHRADLQDLASAGIDGVLIASALHDGRLTPADLQSDC